MAELLRTRRGGSTYVEDMTKLTKRCKDCGHEEADHYADDDDVFPGWCAYQDVMSTTLCNCKRFIPEANERKHLFLMLTIPDPPDHEDAADGVADDIVLAYNATRPGAERVMVNAIPGPQFVDIEYVKEVLAVARERREAKS